MDLSLALALAHWIAALVWAASAAVLALVLLAARRDAAARARALPEARAILSRALRPAALALLLTGAPLALAAGEATQAWALLSAALAAATLAAGRLWVAPRLRAPAALPLAGAELAAQALPVALMLLQPGWTEAALLAGLLACAALVVALWRETAGGSFQPAA